MTAVDSGHSKFVSWSGCDIVAGKDCVLQNEGFPIPFQRPVVVVFQDTTKTSLGTPTATPSTTTNSTFTLSWSPDETLQAASCVIDGGPPAPCTGLTSHTVTLPEGQHSFRVAGTDLSGNTSTLTAAVNFRIIDTALADVPAASSNDRNPSFVFSTLTGLTFDCSLDGAPFTACGAKGGDNRGTLPLSGLADGVHTFRVRARDNSEFDRVPATYTWTVDTVAPTVAFGASGPGEGALQAVNRETFVFSSNEGGTFECQLDGAGFAPCASGITLENLAATPHRFEVRAIDAAGNVSAVAARNWVVFAFPNPAVQGSANPEQVIVTLAFFATAKKKTTKFTSLQVKNVPINATVKVTCAGKGCPSGLKGKGFTKTKAFGTVSLKQFIKKPLRTGDRITVTVSKPNAIAAVKVLTVRASKKPVIATRCLPPGAARPVAC